VERLEGRALLTTVNVDLLSSNTFSPPSVTIHVGDTVHWIWDPGPEHTVQNVTGSIDTFNSGALGPGATFNHTFNTAGTIVYYCAFHGMDNGNGTASGMAGKVIVMANAAAPTLQSIAVTPATQTIGVAATEMYTATGTFSDGSHPNISSEVTWSSSNTAVASITPQGMATGVGAGTSTIMASLNGISGSTTLTVSGSTTPTPTPTFVSEMRMTMGKGAHLKIIGFNLNFSGALDPIVAIQTSHYMVTQPGATKKAKPKPVAVQMAMYNPSNNSVMLMLGKFNTKKPLTATVSGLLGATELQVASFTTKL
jgi:plastocyanin